MTAPARRGDGVGIEVTRTVLRGVRLDHGDPERVHAIADIPIREAGDERSIVDALVRLRAELGNPTAPTRVGSFPPGAALQRVDATGMTGPELNARRDELDRAFGITSTMLLDDGPRRWLVTVAWEPESIRSLERMVEFAGFVDVAVEPSPVALGRVTTPATTWIRRDADAGDAFLVAQHAGVPIAAITVDAVGRVHPDLELHRASISVDLFDGHVDRSELAVLMDQVGATTSGVADDCEAAVFADSPYPPYPSHDIRSIERQCVALGAAVGAAGLAGRARPVDVQLPVVVERPAERPWAIERLTELSESPSGAVHRLTGRVRERRRRGR